jgi:N-acetyl-anhydromuramyl-L-alanine amidase AmpD
VAGLLKVTTFAAFTLDTDKKTPRIRWDSNVSESNVIIGAQAKVPEWNRLSRSPTDRNGHSTIDIRGIKSFFVLRLEPPSISLCDQPAGPFLAPPAADEKKQFGIMAERRLRPLEIEVFVMGGHIRSDLPPRVVRGMTHGRIIKQTGDSIEIDWKPDWISARNAQPRSSVETTDSRNVGKSDRPAGLLASGQWIIIIHRTASPDIGQALNKFIPGKSSAHYIIDVDGHVVKMVDDKNNMANHAGEDAQWEGKAPVNSFSIGIELVNETGPFPNAQMSSLISLLDKLRKTFKIPRDRVLAHCEVRRLEKKGTQWVNQRQDCPGYELEWPILEKNGHATMPAFREDAKLPPGFDEFFLKNTDDALMHPNSDSGKGAYGKNNRALSSGRHDLISQLQRSLVEIGYEEPREGAKLGEFDGFTEVLVKRFQGRYLTGSRKKFLGDNGTEHLGKVTLHTLVMMQAVLAAKGREWRPFW